MSNTFQAIELKVDDDLTGVGTVTDVVRRAGWVRVTVQPAEGTAVCFDLPSSLSVFIDRPVPVPTKQDLPWNQKKAPNPAPAPKKNPTPIPVPVPTATAQATVQPAEVADSASTAPSTPMFVQGGKTSAPNSSTPIPVRSRIASSANSLSGAEPAPSPATSAPEQSKAEDYKYGLYETFD